MVSNSFGMHVLTPMQLQLWFDELAQGFLITVELYLLALTIGFLLGLGLAVSRQYGGPLLSRVATGYIEVFRGTPLLTQLLLVYFSLPALNSFLSSSGFAPIALDWSFNYYFDAFGRYVTIMDWRILASILALGLNSAAYQAEYFRGAILSMGAGQLMAAKSLGMTSRQSIRHVVLPQSLRRVIPSWSNEAAYLPKYTVVAWFIAVSEFFGMAKLVVARTFLALQVYVLVAVVFVLFIGAISKILDIVHARTRIPGL